MITAEDEREICKAARAAGYDTAIIMRFKAGADDCIGLSCQRGGKNYEISYVINQKLGLPNKQRFMMAIRSGA